MTQNLLIAFLGFAVVTLFTPGPNNLMLLASGANYGLRRTVPHMLGVALGLVLKVVAVVFLGWLAWKIAHASAPGSAEASGRPMSFLQAVAFQWVNPKAWAMAISAISAYAPDQSWIAVAIVAGGFATLGFGSCVTWAGLGTRIRLWLTSPARLRVFNWTMAGLLIATLVPVLMH
ncbi:MAG: LysE family translocator [Maritimibacter sp.]